MKKQETHCRICEAPITGLFPIKDLCEHCQRYETSLECCECKKTFHPGDIHHDDSKRVWCDSCYDRYGLCHGCHRDMDKCECPKDELEEPTHKCATCGFNEYASAMTVNLETGKWYCAECGEPKAPCYHTGDKRPVDYQEDGKVKYGAVCLNCGKFLPESVETIEIR